MSPISKRHPLHDWIFNSTPVSEHGQGRTGFFIEAGAHDGVGDSTTHYLEEVYGWDGICVEPADAFAHLVKSRRCKVDNRCLWGRDGESVVFRQIIEDPELSGIIKCFGDSWDRTSRPHVDREKRTVSLTTLLREHSAPPTIDFFQLDTEGSELEILQGHNWDAPYFIRLIAVEHNRVETKQQAIFEFLTSKGYERDPATPGGGIEDWYIHRSAKAAMTTTPFKTIELEILTACDLDCFGCDRMSDVTTAPSMTLDQVKRFVDESLELRWEWERIRLLGGEPTLHPKFLEMVDELVRYRRSYPNVFLQVLTNGHGKSEQYAARMQELDISLHAERKEKGVTPEWFNNTRIVPLDRNPNVGELPPCGIFGPRGCGIGLTRHGYFLDGAGATVARVAGYDVGVMSLGEVTNAAMLEQAKVLCRICGHWNSDDHLVTEKITVTGKVTGAFWTKTLKAFRQHRPVLRVYGE